MRNQRTTSPNARSRRRSSQRRRRRASAPRRQTPLQQQRQRQRRQQTVLNNVTRRIERVNVSSFSTVLQFSNLDDDVEHQIKFPMEINSQRIAQVYFLFRQ